MFCEMSKVTAVAHLVYVISEDKRVFIDAVIVGGLM